MQRRPSLTVHLVHVGTMLQKEGHDVHAAVNAGLCSTEKDIQSFLWVLLNPQRGQRASPGAEQ